MKEKINKKWIPYEYSFLIPEYSANLSTHFSGESNRFPILQICRKVVKSITIILCITNQVQMAHTVILIKG